MEKRKHTSLRNSEEAFSVLDRRPARDSEREKAISAGIAAANIAFKGFRGSLSVKLKQQSKK